MKKVIAIMLCMMVGVSCFALGAFAEGEPQVIATVNGHTYQEGEGVPSPDNVRNISGDFIQYVEVGYDRYLLASPVVLYDGDSIVLYDDGSYQHVSYNRLFTYNSSAGWALNGSASYFEFDYRVDTSFTDSICNQLLFIDLYPSAYGRYRVTLNGKWAIAISEDVNSLSALNSYLSQTPLQFLATYSTPVSTSADYTIIRSKSASLIDSIRPFGSNIFSTISSVSNSIVTTPVLLLSFGFFLIGGMIGLIGRMLSRG